MENSSSTPLLNYLGEDKGYIFPAFVALIMAPLLVV